MKKLFAYGWFLAVFAMIVVAGFSASPSWAYPNPFQAIAAQEHPLSTPTMNTASDHSPPCTAIIDWNKPLSEIVIGTATAPPVTTTNDQWTLVIGDYPNPFALVIIDAPTTKKAWPGGDIPYVYIGNTSALIIDITTPILTMVNGGAPPIGIAADFPNGGLTSGIGNGGDKDVPYVYLGKMSAVQNGTSTSSKLICALGFPPETVKVTRKLT